MIVKESTSEAVMADAFLQRKADGYRVQFLGKNGEPQAKRSITVSLTRRDSSREEQTDRKTKLVTLMTDAEGLIRLGNLEDVKNFTV